MSPTRIRQLNKNSFVSIAAEGDMGFVPFYPRRRVWLPNPIYCLKHCRA